MLRFAWLLLWWVCFFSFWVVVHVAHVVPLPLPRSQLLPDVAGLGPQTPELHAVAFGRKGRKGNW